MESGEKNLRAVIFNAAEILMFKAPHPSGWYITCMLSLSSLAGEMMHDFT